MDALVGLARARGTASAAVSATKVRRENGLMAARYLMMGGR